MVRSSPLHGFCGRSWVRFCEASSNSPWRMKASPRGLAPCQDSPSPHHHGGGQKGTGQGEVSVANWVTAGFGVLFALGFTALPLQPSVCSNAQSRGWGPVAPRRLFPLWKPQVCFGFLCPGPRQVTPSSCIAIVLMAFRGGGGGSANVASEPERRGCSGYGAWVLGSGVFRSLGLSMLDPSQEMPWQGTGITRA